MKNEINIDKARVSRAVITNIIYERNPDMIHARHIKGYDNPIKVRIKGKKEGYTPDITAIFDETLHIYEIELDPKPLTDKWQVFSLYTKMNKGKLHLVVPDKLKNEVKKELDKNDIHAGVIYFKT